jgi:hypothetical protein
MTSVNVTAVTNTVTVTEGDTTVVTVTTAGPQGPGGGAGAAYVHTQASPATTWTINHNLGFRPSVELLDSGSQEIDGDYSTSDNQSNRGYTEPSNCWASSPYLTWHASFSQIWTCKVSQRSSTSDAFGCR